MDKILNSNKSHFQRKISHIINLLIIEMSNETVYSFLKIGKNEIIFMLIAVSQLSLERIYSWFISVFE